ncbi:hypothetical protein HWA77_16890 [Photobacterium damselae subsp. damselae]|uniref:Uncharacterized protein n=1 Tax=Photobacterium damselae subsp. damselae TaxID=85581 RepID=A0A850QUV0_PHODD|nr:hypothetical protein [Photobacterium damselae subsp. damselae]
MSDNKKKCVGSVRIYDNNRDNYIYDNYCQLQQKSVDLKNVMAIGFKLRDKAPLLAQLLQLSIESQADITFEQLQEVLSIDKKMDSTRLVATKPSKAKQAIKETKVALNKEESKEDLFVKIKTEPIENASSGDMKIPDLLMNIGSIG